MSTELLPQLRSEMNDSLHPHEQETKIANEIIRLTKQFGDGSDDINTAEDLGAQYAILEELDTKQNIKGRTKALVSIIGDKSVIHGIY